MKSFIVVLALFLSIQAAAQESTSAQAITTYTTSLNGKCAPGFLEGASFRAYGAGKMSWKECYRESAIGTEYRVAPDAYCANGFVEGMVYRNGPGKVSWKDCLRVN